jgi:hypothetical protein
MMYAPSTGASPNLAAGALGAVNGMFGGGSPIPGMGSMIPSLTGGAGGNAGPAVSSQTNPINFSDGSFVVSGSPSLGTSIAGSLAGATNSFSFGSLTQMMPLVLLGALAWYAIKHHK